MARNEEYGDADKKSKGIVLFECVYYATLIATLSLPTHTHVGNIVWVLYDSIDQFRP